MWKKSNDGKKEEIEFTPEDVEKILGMKPDVLATSLAQIADLKTKLEAQDTKLGGLDDIKTSIASLVEKFKTVTPNKNKDTNDGNNNNGGTPEDTFEQDFLLDPRTAIQNMINKSTSGVAATAISTSADMAYSNFKNSKSDFGLFEAEIKAEWDKFPVAYKGKPAELIENIYNMIRGKHLEEVVQDNSKKTGKFFIETGGNSQNNNTNTNTNKTTNDQLTDQEKDVCKKMGVKEEDYLKRKQARNAGVVTFV